MEFCTTRHLLLSIFILQLITVCLRQTFDFLGYMWASVLANFLYTLFIIFGIFGVIQCNPVYTLSYTISTSVWIVWNLFVLCIYTDVFSFVKISILSFGTDGGGWWETNGPGCKPEFLANSTLSEEDPYQPIKPDYITGCIIDFRHVEIGQATLHIILAIWGCIIGIKVSRAFRIQSDCSETKKKKQNGVLPLYSIEYSARQPEELYDDESSHSPEELDNRGQILGTSKPMTPRRVKRRSVNSKSTLPSHYQQRQNSQQPPPYVCRPVSCGGNARSSIRSSTRKQRNSVHNPVSKFLEQQKQLSYHQQILNDSSTSNDSCRTPFTSSQSQLLSASELMNNRISSIGHSNPNYISSTSLDRPPSARSSYSNYHGIRTLAFCKQATPQVPVPSNSFGRNTRPTYSTFFNDGPPAYEIQGAVNSETVI